MEELERYHELDEMYGSHEDLLRRIVVLESRIEDLEDYVDYLLWEEDEYDEELEF